MTLFRKYTRSSPVTAALVALCVMAWLVTAFQSLSVVDTYYDSDLAQGWSLYGPAVMQGQYWRVASSMFMHLDATHLAMNMLLLIFIGPEVERAYGSWLYCAAYLCGGLGASAAVLACDFATPTVGASGALYAMMVLLIGAHRARGFDLRAPLALLLANLAFTFLTPGVSLWGHVGGLVTGVVLLGALSVRSSRLRIALVACTYAGIFGLVAARLALLG